MNRNDRAGFDRIGLGEIGFQKIRYRRLVVLLLGLVFVLAVWPLGFLGLSGGVWQEAGRSAYVETFRAMHAAVSLPQERLP